MQGCRNISGLFWALPSGAIEETGTVLGSTLCCMALCVGVRDSGTIFVIHLLCVALCCFLLLLARSWYGGMVRNIWRSGSNELRQPVRISLHFTQVCIRRQVCHPPYGQWEPVPLDVCTDQSNSGATQDEAEDEAAMCVLFCKKRSSIAVFDECKEHCCSECIDTHTCGTGVAC